jgi:hypothetical protein
MLKAWSVTIFSSRLSCANGPSPWTAAHAATTDAIRAAGAAPWSRKRQAASAIRGSTRYSSRNWFWNRKYVMAPTAVSITKSSIRRVHDSARTPRRGTKASSSGATSSTPIASPAHQTAQVDQKRLIGMAPNSARTALPMVALSIIPRSAPRKTMATASRMRSSSG